MTQLLLLLAALSILQTPPAALDSLCGTVEDGSGRPLHEAEVRLLDREDQLLSRQRTDHLGRFTFGAVPTGTRAVAAAMEGFEAVALDLRLLPEGRPLTLVLIPILPQVASEISVFGAVPRTAASSSELRRRQFEELPVDDTADVLRAVPGLTVVQHAGGGKANQYLIRGFDTDHGTDFLFSFGGIPVNMVSHAHGQGYSDLNFVIPEALEGIEVFKGPYFAEFGNLATAGAGVMRLRETLPSRFWGKIEGGQFDTLRLLAGYSPRSEHVRGFLMAESRYSNGPFLAPQGFARANLISRWTFDLSPTQQLSLLGTGYSGRWDQSGQIPLREVEAGRLDRFDSIDPSEGGDSQRFNFSLSHRKLWASQILNSQFYYVHYELDLFSNFTYFLNDARRGDGIFQRDNREIVGGHVQYHVHHGLGGAASVFTAGFDYRQDFADVGLFRQQRRRVFDSIVDSRINERNVAFYLQEEWQLHPTLKAIIGLRHDRLQFDVRDRQEAGPRTALAGAEARSLTGPKMSLVWAPRQQTGPEFYANFGRGFHSNDARSVVADPSSAALASADGYEFGYRQVFGALEIAAAYWLLDLQGELVFVGDEGATELSGPTRRQGPEVELKWRLSDTLWLDADWSYTWAGFRGNDHAVARAPRFVASGGLAFQAPWKVTGKARLRHVGDHPIVEDASVDAQGHTVVDLYLERPLGERLQLYMTVENLLNADVKEAQTFFESRLPGEAAPVADNHFTPGNPFTLKFGIRFGL